MKKQKAIAKRVAEVDQAQRDLEERKLANQRRALQLQEEHNQEVAAENRRRAWPDALNSISNSMRQKPRRETECRTDALGTTRCSSYSH